MIIFFQKHIAFPWQLSCTTAVSGSLFVTHIGSNNIRTHLLEWLSQQYPLTHTSEQGNYFFSQTSPIPCPNVCQNESIRETEGFLAESLIPCNLLTHSRNKTYLEVWWGFQERYWNCFINGLLCLHLGHPIWSRKLSNSKPHLEIALM